MVLGLLPLIDEHHGEQRRHDEFDAGGVKVQDRAEQRAERRARDPVGLVEQGDEEHEPAAVHALRRGDGAVDGEGLVAHAEDQVGLFPAHALVLFQHGDAVEQMPRIDHQRQKKGVQRRVGREQQLHRDELHRAGEDEGAHSHRVKDGKAAAAHQKAIGHGDEQKADADGQGIGQRGAECFLFHGCSFLKILQM